MGIFRKKQKGAEAEVRQCRIGHFDHTETFPLLVAYRDPELRPCFARGRKAIFHRWINSAHPVPPRGMELNDQTRYFQFRRTEALVEYEDGTIDRVYPTDLKFIDGGSFSKFDWSNAGDEIDPSRWKKEADE